MRHSIPEIAKISARAAWAGSDWRLLRIRVACHESFRAAVCRVYEDDVRWLTPWRIDGQKYDRVLEQLGHCMDGTALKKQQLIRLKRRLGRLPHRKRALGLAYAPQEQALFQDLSARDNLRLGLADDRSFEARLADVSGWFPVLTARLFQHAGTLSGGEQKMLIVARGLIAEPRLFLLDEVTEGLQPSVVDRLAEVLATTRRERGTAMLVVEQHLPFVLGLADSFAVLKRGEVVDTGPVDAGSAVRIDEHMRL